MTCTERVIADAVREVAELPDRTSPADAPDMMLVTADELAGILRAALAAMPDGREAALDDAVTIVEWRSAQFAALIAAGKGERGKPGYVRDTTWLSWMEKREMCRELADRIRSLKAQPAERTKATMSKALNRAIMHAVNYHGLDARLNMPDWQIADLITAEVFKHLCGMTDVQIIERMTPEERAQIGQPALRRHGGLV